jgi:hypothetical protein
MVAPVLVLHVGATEVAGLGVTGAAAAVVKVECKAETKQESFPIQGASF